jgi:DNA-directed RNA polymerase sigma subunit (sigma70/sigma32)
MRTLALTENEKRVLTARFLESKTYQEAANDLRLTRERAHQIEAKALRKLRLQKADTEDFDSLMQYWSSICSHFPK